MGQKVCHIEKRTTSTNRQIENNFEEYKLIAKLLEELSKLKTVMGLHITN